MGRLIKIKKKPESIIINRLAAVLKEERVSNKALAAALGYEAATVSKWSTNTIQPSLTTLLSIALTVNRDLKDFFISTKDIEANDKKRLLKELAVIAERSKGTGGNKK